MFIRGIIGLCPCGAELSVRTSVLKFEVFGQGFQYITLCDSCSRQEDIIVSADQHKSAARYLKQVVQNSGLRDYIQEPVSPEEELLVQWKNDLANVTVEMFSAGSS